MNIFTQVSIWFYLLVVGAFALGMMFGIGIGRRNAYTEFQLQQKQLEATRLWTESISKYMGGQNAGK
jgi:hypothetical protein